MALKIFAPAILAAAAAAIAFAPGAAADRPDRDDVSDPGPKVRAGTSQQQDVWNNAPKGWTNEAQWARPGASNPFGTLPKPPIFAMD